MKKGYIYKITSPSNRVYIGQTINIKRRFDEYNRLDCKKQPAIYNSFNKYGVDKHIFEVVEECNIDELNERERYYQDLYDVIGENGLNCKLTETNNKSGLLSNYTIKKMSISKIGNKSRTGMKHSEETKRKIGKANKGKKITDDHKKSIINTLKGRKLSEDHKKKIGDGVRGKKFNISKDQMLIKSIYMSQKFSKKVIDNNTGIIYSSAKEFSEIHNVDYCRVRNILNKKVKNIYNISKYEK